LPLRKSSLPQPAGSSARRALQGGTGADQIVEDDRRAIAYFADQQLAGDDTAAAPLVDEAAEGSSCSSAARARRNCSARAWRRRRRAKRQRFFRRSNRAKWSTKSGIASEICRLAAEGVLESGYVGDIEGNQHIRAGSLSKSRHVFCGDRVACVRAPILAGVAKIGNHDSDPLGTRVLQRPDEE
jgi:hypothetical protein